MCQKRINKTGKKKPNDFWALQDGIYVSRYEGTEFTFYVALNPIRGQVSSNEDTSIPYVPKVKPDTLYTMEVKQLKVNSNQQHTHLLSS